MLKKDKYIGCLIGGAAGDALGFAVEFSTYNGIVYRYGKDGICNYDLTDGKAIISDDTQMTLFTADGILRCVMDGSRDYLKYIHRSYLDWLKTQKGRESVPVPDCSPLLNVPELNAHRAPGNTCLGALSSGTAGTVDRPINDSKGCGGVMRVAPIGLLGDKKMSIDDADMLAAQAAALTHGHDLGYIPAAALAHIIRLTVNGADLKYAVCDSIEAMKRLFPSAPHLDEFTDICEAAIELSGGNMPDLSAIKKLGEGWVAEETLAIAIYCALKYENDFERAIIASVNHDGDSDSTGAVTGNILGAYLGVNRIPHKFIDNLELKNLIEDTAINLYKSF